MAGDDRVDSGKGILYQDARWRRIGRVQYGMIAYPLWLLALAGSIATGALDHVVLALAIFTPPIGIYEWRLRKMGLIIRSDAIILARALNHTRIPWADIDSFRITSPPGLADYGNRRIGVKRHPHAIPRSTMVISTVWLSLNGEKRWPPLNGPSSLKWSGGEITDVIGFLDEQLTDHQRRFPRYGGTPQSSAAGGARQPPRLT